MRLAITADLHWGHGQRGDDATRALADFLRHHPPDAFLLGGDVGTGDHFASCLELFQALPCPKMLVPGNHDLWVADNDSRGDSLRLFEELLPGWCAVHDFHYLDHGPLHFSEARLAVVGTVNWYDYSWSLEKLKHEALDWEWRLNNKAFTRGRHNDRRFVRWPLDDVRFTQQVVARFAEHLRRALDSADKALVLTHHPACYALNFPREGPPRGWDGLLWDALSGNTALEEVLRVHGDRLAAIFSGHTHRARVNKFGAVPAYNIGGDYHYKRLLLWDWPAGEVQEHIFGSPEKF